MFPVSCIRIFEPSRLTNHSRRRNCVISRTIEPSGFGLMLLNKQMAGLGQGLLNGDKPCALLIRSMMPSRNDATTLVWLYAVSRNKSEKWDAIWNHACHVSTCGNTRLLPQKGLVQIRLCPKLTFIAIAHNTTTSLHSKPSPKSLNKESTKYLGS